MKFQVYEPIKLQRPDRSWYTMYRAVGQRYESKADAELARSHLVRDPANKNRTLVVRPSPEVEP